MAKRPRNPLKRHVLADAIRHPAQLPPREVSRSFRYKRTIADRFRHALETVWLGNRDLMVRDCGIIAAKLTHALRHRKQEPDQVCEYVASEIDGIRNVRGDFLLGRADMLLYEHRQPGWRDRSDPRYWYCVRIAFLCRLGYRTDLAGFARDSGIPGPRLRVIATADDIPTREELDKIANMPTLGPLGPIRREWLFNEDFPPSTAVPAADPIHPDLTVDLALLNTRTATPEELEEIARDHGSRGEWLLARSKALDRSILITTTETDAEADQLVQTAIRTGIPLTARVLAPPVDEATPAPSAEPTHLESAEPSSAESVLARLDRLERENGVLREKCAVLEQAFCDYADQTAKSLENAANLGESFSGIRTHIESLIAAYGEKGNPLDSMRSDLSSLRGDHNQKLAELKSDIKRLQDRPEPVPKIDQVQLGQMHDAIRNADKRSTAAADAANARLREAQDVLGSVEDWLRNALATTEDLRSRLTAQEQGSEDLFGMVVKLEEQLAALQDEEGRRLPGGDDDLVDKLCVHVDDLMSVFRGLTQRIEAVENQIAGALETELEPAEQMTIERWCGYVGPHASIVLRTTAERQAAGKRLAKLYGHLRHSSAKEGIYLVGDMRAYCTYLTGVSSHSAEGFIAWYRQNILSPGPKGVHRATR